MRIVLVVAIGIATMALTGCKKLESALMPGFNEENVVLSDKPTVLGPKPVRFAAGQPLNVRGFTTDFCVVLADDVAKGADTDAKYDQLRGGAHLLAVLHANSGKDYSWKCGGWSLTQNESGKDTMSACLKWECNQSSAPPKGTEISSIDLSSDRPLRILGAEWSSTDSFDFVSQPPPDRVATPSAEYRDLEHGFGGKAAWPSPAKTALQVVLNSNRRRLSTSTFNSSLGIRLAAEGIQLQPEAKAIGMDVVTVPASAVEACSMSCFSNLAKSTNLLLPGVGIEIDVLNSPDVVNWCWNHRIPMATADARRAWQYDGARLPARSIYSYTQQLSSRAAYDEQADRSCMGY